jgi:hypothetical protein
MDREGLRGSLSVLIFFFFFGFFGNNDDDDDHDHDDAGTLKKLYKHAHGYTTLLTASYLSHTLSFLPPPSTSTSPSVPEPSSTIVPVPIPTSSAPPQTTHTQPATNPAQSDRVRRAEVDAWRKRREDILLGLRAVEEG